MDIATKMRSASSPYVQIPNVLGLDGRSVYFSVVLMVKRSIHCLLFVETCPGGDDKWYVVVLCYLTLWEILSCMPSLV